MKLALIPVISGIIFSFTGIDVLSLYNCAYTANAISRQAVKPKEKSGKPVKSQTKSQTKSQNKPKSKQNACTIDSCQ